MTTSQQMIEISIHALLAESDVRVVEPGLLNKLFLSTLSLRRATHTLTFALKTSDISIHALLAESDYLWHANVGISPYFYPRSPCGERPVTADPLMYNLYFYPRSPCGERLGHVGNCFKVAFISIHALLAESDGGFQAAALLLGRFLSTLSLRRATAANSSSGKSITISIHALLAESDGHVGNCFKVAFISIHALLAESDRDKLENITNNRNFYPRSPCGERLCIDDTKDPDSDISIHALLAESDRGRC